jgi:hypothetical protein
MRTPPENPDDPLLDGVLADEGWAALNAAVKSRALGALRARRRQRALLTWGGSAVGACALALATVNFVSPPNTPAPGPVASVPPRHTAHITEEKLMSYFPPGSCTIAEIDGERRFIILDPDIAANGVAFSGPLP